MINLEIPGCEPLAIEHLVLDYNGTLALDGRLLPGVAQCLQTLSARLAIHVLTADTFGSCASELQALPLTLSVVPSTQQDEHKKNYVEVLGSHACVCIGNGRNDCLMLECAAVGIAVIQQECAAAVALRCADIIAPDILSALGLLQNPLRLAATLRL
ncbi:MAG: ATPase P [Deltaproteobacteria bacterium]|nr:ATPase P [Deltaproteobacteria bacterium]